MKKALSLVLALVFCFSFAVSAFADETEGKTNILKGIYDESVRTQYVPDDPEFSGIEISDEMRQTVKKLVDANIVTLTMLLKPPTTAEMGGHTEPDAAFKLDLERFPTFKDLQDFIAATYTDRVVDALFNLELYIDKDGELWIIPYNDVSFGHYSIYSEYKIIMVELTEDHCYFDLDVPQYEEFTGDGISQAKIRYEAVKENDEWKLTDVFDGARLYESNTIISGVFFYQEEEIPDIQPTTPDTETTGTTEKDPETSDVAGIVPFAALSVLSLAAIAFVFAKRKRANGQ